MGLAQAAVVVPVYKSSPDPDEAAALHQCSAVLGAHPLILIAPRSLDLSAYRLSGSRLADVVRLDDAHFAGATAFSALLLRADFYRRFFAYRYVLIHQLDAFVFEDRLQEWCERGYDYVGAPWLQDWPLRMYRRTLRSGGVAARTLKRAMTLLKRQSYRVGNGGFSLRRVRSFYRTAFVARAAARAWRRNEDTFWGIWAANFTPGFRVPALDEALRFAVETEPRAAIDRLGGELPFGCHAWARWDREFWRPHIARRRAG